MKMMRNGSKKDMLMLTDYYPRCTETALTAINVGTRMHGRSYQKDLN